MERYIPVDKLSKKQKKAYYAARRGSWNGVNPVSRQVPSKKIYNRKQAKHWRDEDALPVLFMRYCLKSAVWSQLLKPHSAYLF
jgi:hypothetical protein